MTTLTAATETMYDLFLDAWGSTTSVTADNESFDPPDNASWARISIRHNAGGQQTLGGVGDRKFFRRGSFFVQIYTTEGQGRNAGDILAAQARDVFEGVSITGTTVRFLDVIVRETGLDGKWYQHVVEATFEYEETK